MTRRPTITAAAAALGRRGGAADSPAQRAQRASTKPGAGRPRGSFARPRCGDCEAKGRTCYHLEGGGMDRRTDRQARAFVARYFRSTGNFADNVREMGADDIASQYSFSLEQARWIYAAIREPAPELERPR